MIGHGVLCGLVLGLVIHVLSQPIEYVREVEAKEEPQEVVVKLEVKIDWTEERIIEEIRKTFHEAPNTAVAIFKCESGLKADIQSRHILSYGREQSFGVSQIHARDWHNKAVALGYEDYRTDPGDNLKMARYIYDGRGNFKDWSCYNSGAYKRFL